MLAAAEAIVAENLRGRGHCDGGPPPHRKNNVKDWVGGGGRI